MHLTRRFVYFVVIGAVAAALIVLNIRAWQERESARYAGAFPSRLEEIFSAHTMSELPFFVADVDGDGNDDLLVNEPNRLLWYRFGKDGASLAGERTYERPGSTQMVTDADGDGAPEFFVCLRAPEGWVLACYRWFAREERAEPAYTIGPLYPIIEDAYFTWRRILYFGSFPSTEDRRREIFLGFNPRRGEGASNSLRAFDGSTGNELWRSDVYSETHELACDDFGAGDRRVVLTTSATSLLESCYAFCYDQSDGAPTWTKRLGGVGSRGHVAIVDANGDGRNEIVLSRSLPPGDSVLLNDPKAWNVALLDGDGNILQAARLPGRTGSVFTVNIEGDSAPEIIVDGTGARFFVLDDTLATIRTVAPPPADYPKSGSLEGIWDLNGDGRPEIVHWLEQRLDVMDCEGAVIAQREYSKSGRVQLVRHGGRNWIAVASVDSIHVLAMAQVPFAVRFKAHSTEVTIALLGAALVAVWGVFHGRRLVKRRRERGLVFDTERGELLTAMMAYYHGGTSLKTLDRIRFHLKNWERIRSDGPTREQLLSALHRTYGDTVVPELKHLVVLARRARVPEVIWSTLLGEADSAGKEMEAIVAMGAEESSRQEDRIGRAIELLRSVDASIAAIRAYLRSEFRTNVKEALERLVARFREEHAASGIAFSLSADPAGEAPVFISPVAFDKVYEALLSNAVRATEGMAGGEIAVAVHWEGDYCRIDVRDNGCGIPRDDWDRVFDRHYTTKTEGGGFGLYYAREELAKYQGKIFVFESAAGCGTTMRTVLRKSEKAGSS